MKYSYLILIAIGLLTSCSKTTMDTVTTEANTVQKETKVESFRSTAPAAGPARKIQIGKAETFELDNGLQVIVVENHKIPQVSYQLTLKNDPIIEGEQKGYVGFAGDLLSRGTTTRSKSEIDEAVDFIGADFSTSASGFFANSLTKHSDALLDIVTDVLYNPSFSAQELEKIRTQSLSGLETAKTDADAMASNVVSIVNYGTMHPYGEVQTIESTKKITLEQCKVYYDRFFIPNNAYLIVVGDITIDEARETANKYFSKWKRKPFKPIVNQPVKTPSSRNVAFAHKEGAVQSVIRITYPIKLEPGDADVIPSSLTNSILGGSFSSRLSQNLREDKAYTYGAYSNLSSDAVIGSFTATASVRNEVTDSSIVQFLYEIERIVNEPVSNEELDAMKNYRTGGFARALESPQTIARFALNTIKYELPEDYYETYLEKLSAVTPEQVTAMAQKYILPNNTNIVVVGNKDEVADRLLPFDSDGKIDFYDPFGRKVENNSALPSDATAESVIADYLTAIGGKEKLNSLKSSKTTMSAQMMGQNITIEINQVAPDKFAMKVGNGTMVFQEQKFDGSKAKISGMGQAPQILTEGEQFESLKNQATIVPQLKYNAKGYSAELKGVEEVEGASCYKMIISDPSGKKSTEFYNLENGLLARTISTQEGMGQTISVVTDYADYDSFGDVLFPKEITISGAMPVPMVMKVEKIELNGQIDSSVFQITE